MYRKEVCIINHYHEIVWQEFITHALVRGGGFSRLSRGLDLYLRHPQHNSSAKLTN